jgi:hypothetical protein
MLEWLFPGWSNPALLLAFVAARVAVNALLTALVAGAVGRRSRRVTAMAAWTVGSALLQVLLLRPGGLGLGSSYVELGGQLVLLVLAGGTLYARGDGQPPARRVAGLLALLVGLGLLLFTIPLYGEAFVAP